MLSVSGCVQMPTTFMLQAFHMKLDFSNEDSREAAKDRSFRVTLMFHVSLFKDVSPSTVLEEIE